MSSKQSTNQGWIRKGILAMAKYAQINGKAARIYGKNGLVD